MIIGDAPRKSNERKDLFCSNFAFENIFCPNVRMSKIKNIGNFQLRKNSRHPKFMSVINLNEIAKISSLTLQRTSRKCLLKIYFVKVSTIIILPSANKQIKLIRFFSQMHKNNAEASILLVRGNYFYEKKRVFEALLAYNNSLCFAEPLTNIAAICYGKRSVVYFDFKEYELCLANIELARQQNPTYEIGMLEDLKVECNKLLKTHNYEADENPMNFFKLSYPANVKLPCLADCLQLKVNKKFGRHIISTRDLKVGDVIAVTDFSFIFFNKRARLHHCSHCLESSTKLNLIPCTGCVQGKICY